MMFFSCSNSISLFTFHVLAIRPSRAIFPRWVWGILPGRRGRRHDTAAPWRAFTASLHALHIYPDSSSFHQATARRHRFVIGFYSSGASWLTSSDKHIDTKNDTGPSDSSRLSPTLPALPSRSFPKSSGCITLPFLSAPTTVLFAGHRS
ncbi:hypothetical protein OF83DRAFT_892734 [Amylostereum chailletii]|nr:hypothetical protein OF83DRAFT_892734 [Amylostereum chailletii]